MPKADSKRIITFANQSDFISFRCGLVTLVSERLRECFLKDSSSPLYLLFHVAVAQGHSAHEHSVSIMELLLLPALKICRSYVVTLCNWACIFECYMARRVVKNKHQNNMWCNAIGLCARNTDTILGSVVKHSWKGLYEHFKRKRIYTLTSYKFCISSSILEHEMTSLWFATANQDETNMYTGPNCLELEVSVIRSYTLFYHFEFWKVQEKPESLVVDLSGTTHMRWRQVWSQ